MPDILIRNLSVTTINKLKARAKQKGRSVQSELKAIVEEATSQMSFADTRALAAQIRARLTDRAHADSTTLIAGDRRR